MQVLQQYISYKVQTRKFSCEPQNSRITQDWYEEIVNCSASQSQPHGTYANGNGKSLKTIAQLLQRDRAKLDTFLINVQLIRKFMHKIGFLDHPMGHRGQYMHFI